MRLVILTALVGIALASASPASAKAIEVNSSTGWRTTLNQVGQNSNELPEPASLLLLGTGLLGLARIVRRNTN